MPEQRNILFTGFKGARNPSCELVRQIGRSSLFLTNSYSGLERDIASLCRTYDGVFMFGVDKSLRREVRLECCASLDGHTLWTDCDISRLSRLIAERGIPCRISRVPTAYLCNSAYYQMLRKNNRSIFIHIPSARGLDEKWLKDLAELFRSL